MWKVAWLAICSQIWQPYTPPPATSLFASLKLTDQQGVAKKYPFTIFCLSQQSLGISKQNFTNIFSNSMCTQWYYRNLISLQCFKVISITVMPPSDFTVLKNLYKKSFLKIACRTSCDTAVGISLAQKCGLYIHPNWMYDVWVKSSVTDTIKPKISPNSRNAADVSLTRVLLR